MKKAIYKIKGLKLEDLKGESALENWFYEVVQKQEDQLNLLDISRMLRQEVLLDIAIPAALDILRNDPLSGEMYEGQLQELLQRVLETHPESR